MAREPHIINIRASKRTARQWREALALYKALNKDKPGHERSAAAFLGVMLAKLRIDLKRKLGPDWARALEQIEHEQPELPDRGKLDPPPMVD